MADPAWIAGFFGLLTVIVAARLQAVSQQNLKLREALNEKKQAFYVDLLKFLDGLQNGEYNDDTSKVVEKTKKVVNEFVYYASPNALKSFGDLMQHIYTSDQSSEGYGIHLLKLIAELKVQVRRDLGVAKRWRESWFDILRLTITDISNYVPLSYKNHRGPKTQPNLYHGKSILK